MEVSLSGYKVVYGDKVLNALSLIGMRLKHPERQEEYEKPISKPDFIDRKSTRLNSSHVRTSRMPSSA